jgi:DNA polymerase/3'-5' exonuclease PolX/histidinol phosphatase-like PHP family hydrolase
VAIDPSAAAQDAASGASEAPPPSNAELARIFHEIGDLLEIKGELVYKAVAYHRAADAIAHAPLEVARAIRQGQRPKIPGVGAALAAKLEELARTGRLEYYERLKAEFPPTLLELRQVSGVGPRTIRLLYDTLGIESLEDLRRAARSGLLGTVPGLGEKTVAGIVAGLEALDRRPRRMTLQRAEAVVAELEAALGAVPGVTRVVAAGSFRRRAETVGDIDLLVETRHPEPVVAAFTGLPGVEEVIARGLHKSSIRLRGGPQVDLMIMTSEAAGTYLVHFTGSKAHNVRLRGMARERGWSLSEKGFLRIGTGDEGPAATETPEVETPATRAVGSPERTDQPTEEEIASPPTAAVGSAERTDQPTDQGAASPPTAAVGSSEPVGQEIASPPAARRATLREPHEEPHGEPQAEPHREPHQDHQDHQEPQQRARQEPHQDHQEPQLVTFPTEAETYAFLGLPFIEPELREDRGEIEAALAGRLPTLVELADLRGDLHSHSDWSDGVHPVEAMAQAARRRGYAYLVLTDHSAGLGIARGLDPGRFAAQRALVEELNARFAAEEDAGLAPPETPSEGFRLLHGCELEIRADGRLDLPDDVLAQFDIVVAALHQGRRQGRQQLTDRVLAAIRSPHVDVIAHPSGRLLGEREELDLDWEAIFQEAARTGTALEIDGSPDRLDLAAERARRAVELGCLVSIDSDAHRTTELDNVRYGVWQARRGWVGPGAVVNTRSRADLVAWARGKPERVGGG